MMDPRNLVRNVYMDSLSTFVSVGVWKFWKKWMCLKSLEVSIKCTTKSTLLFVVFIPPLIPTLMQYYVFDVKKLRILQKSRLFKEILKKANIVREFVA